MLAALLVTGILYWVFQSKDQAPTTFQNTNSSKPSNSKQSEENISTNSKAEPKQPVANSGNTSPETGWSGFPGSSEPEPKPNVTAEFYVKNGSEEKLSVSAKQGERVSIKFTANFRDEVIIKGYEVVTNIEPMRDSTVSFNADKAGEFGVRLVKANKIIGTLRVR